MPCSCPLVHKDFRKYSNREPRAQKKSLHYSGSPQRHLPDSVRPAIPCLPCPHNQLHCVAYGLTECRSSGLTADSSILVQPHRQKFLEGRGAGRENLFPKRFPSSQAVLSSNLQASACRPQNKKIPGGAGTKKDPLALRAARGSRTIFGSGLLSHMTLCSIIGDGELNFRVRNGVGCTLSSMATKEIWQIY